MEQLERAIIQKARKMGLTYQGKKKGAFQKNHTPYNKGKVMSPELREKVSRTWFKKGHMPANSKAISLRYHKKCDQYYFYIRIAKADWKLLQRYVYETHHGTALAEGEVIRFKDGDPYNFDIGNLQKVSRYQNLLLNNPRVKIPNDEQLLLNNPRVKIPNDEQLLKAYEILNNLKKRIKQLEDGTE
jgi:hypothetical protein